MLKKLLAIILLASLINGALQAGYVEHVPNDKAFTDQHGKRFHNHLEKDYRDGKYHKTWPADNSYRGRNK